MQPILAKTLVKTKVTEAILATLAFFSIYNLPLPAKKIWELLYRCECTYPEMEKELNRLTQLGIIAQKSGLYALAEWDERRYFLNQLEIQKRWNKIKKYYWLLSAIPFVRHISVINSVAMGNADHESDIDFFVVTSVNRLYFVRSVIIIIFKLLGVYKTRTHVNERFCFGFYVDSDHMPIKKLLLPQEDPYMVFWLSTIIPIYSLRFYEKLIKENKWVYSQVPNFRTHDRLEMYRKLTPARKTKKILEWIFLVPSLIAEPLLRFIHVRHTFNLPENSWKSSSTIANKHMLKLHAKDPRKDLREQFYKVLQNYL